MNDTKPEISKIYFNMIMNKSPVERLIMGFGMVETARKIVLSTISDESRKMELFLRFYGDEFDDKTLQKIELRFKEGLAADGRR